MSEIRVDRRAISIPMQEQIVAYRKNHGINETAKAFHVAAPTVSKYAPTSKIETNMRKSMGIRAYHQRRRDEIAIRKALIQPEIDEIERKIAELMNRKNELLKSVG